MDTHRARRRLSRHGAAGGGHALDGPVVQRVHAGRGARRSRAGKTNYRTDYRWVDLEQISPHAAVAVIAAEDQFFPFHTGFDFKSIREAVRTTKQQAGKKGRACAARAPSRQQVAKNLFLWPGRSYVRKGLEVYFTLLIELTWPKERIIEVYLNVAQFGDGIYGVEAAAQRFYRMPAARLGRYEARCSPPCCRTPSPSRRTRRPIMCQAPRLDPGADARAGRRALSQRARKPDRAAEKPAQTRRRKWG